MMRQSRISVVGAAAIHSVRNAGMAARPASKTTWRLGFVARMRSIVLRGLNHAESQGEDGST